MALPENKYSQPIVSSTQELSAAGIAVGQQAEKTISTTTKTYLPRLMLVKDCVS